MIKKKKKIKEVILKINKINEKEKEINEIKNKINQNIFLIFEYILNIYYILIIQKISYYK